MECFRIFTLLGMCSMSSQEPILGRINYKGLKGVIPNSQLSINGVRRFVYYHDQAVAVVDVNEQKEIRNCDIIEVYEPEEATEVLGNLSKIARPTEVSFTEMTGLMYRCQTLDRMQSDVTAGSNNRAIGALEHANAFGSSAFNLLSGIIPGTKWCGTGDIAKYYHDLGTNTEIDRCCRTHDLCPVKVRGQSSRYNLTNYSVYSKSHCDCDNAFYNCLKSVGTSAANIMGKIYFNIIKVGCVEDFPKNTNSKIFSTESMRRFAATKLSF